MKTLLQFVIMAFLCCSGVNAQDANFSLHFDGVVARKLTPDTAIRMWSPYYSGKPSIIKEYTVRDFPQKLDSTTFEKRYWIVEFRNDQGILFSIELSPDLFDEPRKIKVKLDAPKPVIQPFFIGPGDIRYTGNITQRMRYRDLPRINKKSKKLVLSSNPTLAIVDARTGEIMKSSEMYSGCLGFGWWEKFLDVDPPDKTNFEFVVTYDSGGLFETMVTKCEFTFHKSLHGK